MDVKRPTGPSLNSLVANAAAYKRNLNDAHGEDSPCSIDLNSEQARENNSNNGLNLDILHIDEIGDGIVNAVDEGVKTVKYHVNYTSAILRRNVSESV
jgi:hypothetical protein